MQPDGVSTGTGSDRVLLNEDEIAGRYRLRYLLHSSIGALHLTKA
jgi:hypothetical protein